MSRMWRDMEQTGMSSLIEAGSNWKSIPILDGYFYWFQFEIDGVKKILKEGAEKSVSLASHRTPLTNHQFSKLIELDLFEDGIFVPPVRENKIDSRESSLDDLVFNFISINVKLVDADDLLDGESPVRFGNDPKWSHLFATGYKFHWFTEKDTMAHLMHKVGAFESVSQARKNGWNKPIPFGFTMLTVGKRKIPLAIVNVHLDDAKIKTD